MNTQVRAGAGPRAVRAGWAAVAVVVMAGATRADAAEPTLDAALLREAPRVLAHLKGHNYRNVGVLKFRVKKGDEPVSDRVGTLNLDLAARLEIALVLATDLKAPIGVVHDASAVAAKTPGATHLTEPGRRALFGARYPLAWGKDLVEPDAFLTGVAQLGPDLKTVTVTVLGFGKGGGPLEKVGEFTASTDAPTLAAAGESFRTRGLAAEGAADVRAGRMANPLQDPSAPVGLEVVYDDKPVPLEARGGKTLVREPAEGQSVRFVLRKKDRTPDRYGVVLLVNGLNTLGKERFAPASCSKWILGPDTPTIEVRGFQTGSAKAEAFRVLSASESGRAAMNYGTDAGTVTLVVFRERTGQTPSAPLDDEGEDLAAIARGALPDTPPVNLAALKGQLRGGVVATRGMIVEGQKVNSATRTVTFAADPTPVLAATLTYYRPGPNPR